MKKILPLVLLLGFCLALASACAPAPTPLPAAPSPDARGAGPTLECPAPTPVPTATAALTREEAQQEALKSAATIEELIALYDQFLQQGEYALAYEAAMRMTDLDPKNDAGYTRASQAMLTQAVENYQKMNEMLVKGMENVWDNQVIRDWIAEHEPSLRLYQPPIPEPANLVGNTNSNIINGGLVTRQGDWIYFSNPAQNGRLYKMHTDGSQVTQLSQDSAADINVIGEWVYYSALNEDNALVKLRTDGSQRTRIGPDGAQNILVADDWIYYANRSDSLAIYKIKTDGSQRTRLSGDGPFIHISLDDGWLYFSEKRAGERTFFRMRTDGSQLTPLPMPGNFSQAFAQDGVVYSIVNDEKRIYRMLPDGSEKQSLHDDCEIYTINVVGEELFLSFRLDVQDFLSMVKTDRSDSGKIAAESTRNLFLVGDGWLYYLNLNDNGLLYRMRTDGSEIQPVQ